MKSVQIGRTGRRVLEAILALGMVTSASACAAPAGLLAPAPNDDAVAEKQSQTTDADITEDSDYLVPPVSMFPLAFSWPTDHCEPVRAPDEIARP